jgi:hypothetical protein
MGDRPELPETTWGKISHFLNDIAEVLRYFNGGGSTSGPIPAPVQPVAPPMTV